MRILVVHQEYPEKERKLRRDACERAASPGTSIEFSEIVAGRMVRGPGLSSDLFIALATPHVVEEAKKAEASGVDAVVPLGTLDIGIDAALQEVAIPVVGAGRTGFHMAASLGSRVGVIVYESSTISHTWRLIRQYGVESFITSVRPVNIATRDMSAHRKELREAIVVTGRQQIESEGAEVIFPQGISMVPVHLAAGELAAELGVPVVDALTLSIRMGEFLAATGFRERRSRR